LAPSAFVSASIVTLPMLPDPYYTSGCQEQHENAGLLASFWRSQAGLLTAPAVGATLEKFAFCTTGWRKLSRRFYQALADGTIAVTA